MRGLEESVVIVTGAGGGIGTATCKRLGEEGAKVAVWDVNAKAAKATASQVKKNGGTAQAFVCDITDFNAVKRAVTKTESAFGPINVLINNAGWDTFRPFLKTDPKLWKKIIDINLRGVLHTHYAVLQNMSKRGSGRVINIASDAARVGSSGESVYAACKAGIIGLSKTLAREHARQGITFNVVCPGPTKTGLLETVLQDAGNPDKLSAAFQRAIPMGRLGQPEDLPGIIVFLASEDAAYITGQVISVSGGLTMNG